jgi:predicted nuclease of predicted toxin-antitoxin system
VNILLDENLDWRLRRDLPGHVVESVPLIGWAGIKNGELLARAEKQFEVLITMDANLAHQQDLSKFGLAVIALQAPSNRLADTRPLMPKVLAALSNLQPGTCTIVA